MKPKILHTVTSRGYWRINFQPLKFEQKLRSFEEAQKLVEQSSVELRGWDYPHVPKVNDDKQGIDRHDKFIEGWIDWNNHIEFWRLYKSGQFLHYLALRNDWPRGEFFGMPTTKEERDAFEWGKHVGFLDTTFTLTEAYEFLSRLQQYGGLYKEGVKVCIQLHTKGRRILSVDDTWRAGFSYERSNDSNIITFESEYTFQETLDPKKLSRDFLLSFFDKFGWNPSEEQVEADQNKLYNKDF